MSGFKRIAGEKTGQSISIKFTTNTSNSTQSLAYNVHEGKCSLRPKAGLSEAVGDTEVIHQYYLSMCFFYF